MKSELTYMPIFRLRQEEKKVLQSFDFGSNIYPYVEIIKRRERIQSKSIRKSLPTKEKTFEDIFIPILKQIKAEKIFVDLPVHLKRTKSMQKEVLEFLTTTVYDRKKRTEHIKMFSSLSDFVIPVISTFFNTNNEINTLALQEKDLRGTFKYLAFRTFPNSFLRDMAQIRQIVQPTDYLIVDIEDLELNKTDDDLLDIEKELRDFDVCPIVIVQNVVCNTIKNSELLHGKPIKDIRVGVTSHYKWLHGTAFGDYAGIKKDAVTDGGAISPGFIFYEPVENIYYGFRGDRYMNTKGKTEGRLSDFEDIIVPDVLKSQAVKKIQSAVLPYLSSKNKGWEIIKDIDIGIEKGQNQAKFKRISMEHYLHCIKTNIEAGVYED